MARMLMSVNAGSSSVKIAFYTLDKPPKNIADAQIAGITSSPQMLKFKRRSGWTKEELKERLDSPQDAFKHLLRRCVSDPELSEITSIEDLSYICHRVVHGGDYNDAVLINDETYHHLTKIEDLAPLHNYPALEIVRICMKELPKAKSITYFDSAFHQTIPRHIYTYPISPVVAEKNGLRKYGFHGTSYSFILRSVADFLEKPQEQTNLIVMHIGSGASICAIKHGRSLDTSMGLTPLSGLPGATRSGDIDPSLVFHYPGKAGRLSPASTKEMHITQAEEILNKKSGWKALTGTTDFSKIAVPNPLSQNHKLAFDILIDRICGYVGSYFVKLDGKVDALVFAGGIGERSALFRKEIIQQILSLEFAVNDEKNNRGSTDEDITVMDITKNPTNPPRVLICQTNEQFEMAYHTVQNLSRYEKS